MASVPNDFHFTTLTDISITEDITSPRLAVVIVRLICTLLIGLSPLATMLVFLYDFSNAVLAMFVMHFGCMIFLPSFHILIFNVDLRSWTRYFRWQLEIISGQVVYAFLSFCITLCFGCACYFLVSCSSNIITAPYCVNVDGSTLKSYGLDLPLWQLGILGVYFSFFNPLLEEIFWRFFLFQEFRFFYAYFKAKSNHTLFNDPTLHVTDDDWFHIPAAHPVSGLPNVSVSRPITQSSEICDADKTVTSDVLSHPQPDNGKLFIFNTDLVSISSCCYAAYHVVVVQCFLHKVALSVLSFIFLMICGQIWVIMRHHPKFGCLSMYCMHSALDVCVVISIAIAINPF